MLCLEVQGIIRFMYSETCLCDHLRNRDNLGIKDSYSSPCRPIQYTEMDLRNKTTSELRTFFHSPLGVPNSQVHCIYNCNILLHTLLPW